MIEDIDENVSELAMKNINARNMTSIWGGKVWALKVKFSAI